MMKISRTTPTAVRAATRGPKSGRTNSPTARSAQSATSPLIIIQVSCSGRRRRGAASLSSPPALTSASPHGLRAGRSLFQEPLAFDARAHPGDRLQPGGLNGHPADLAATVGAHPDSLQRRVHFRQTLPQPSPQREDLLPVVERGGRFRGVFVGGASWVGRARLQRLPQYQDACPLLPEEPPE